VQRIAKGRLDLAELQPGRRGTPKSREAQLAGMVCYVRRQLSFTAMQQQQRLLLDRLELLGDGARQATQRRDYTVRVDQAAAREQRAQAVCLRQGRVLMRQTAGLLD
jgi:hypothetical protein